MDTDVATVRCVDCRSEYEPSSGGSIVCPYCGGAAWVSAAIAFPPDRPSLPEKD